MENPLMQILELLAPAQQKISLTLEGLKAMYPSSPHDKPDRNGKLITGATKKNHLHKVNPVWLPGKPGISPALYRRLHLGRANRAK